MLNLTPQLMAVGFLVSFAVADDGSDAPRHSIRWFKNFGEARLASAKEKKPLLIDFEAEWCGFCKKLDRETYADEKVIRFVRDNFIAVKVDTDKHPELKSQFKVNGLPTILFLAPGGEETHRIVGFRPPTPFLKEARESAKSSSALVELKEAADKAPSDIAAQRAYTRALLAAGNAETAVEILAAALEKCPDDVPEKATLLLDLGDARRVSGKAKQAAEIYGKVLALKPEKAGASRRKALLALANVTLALRDHAAAIAALDEFLGSEFFESRPLAPSAQQEQLEALFLRGYAYAVLKDAGKALADLKTAAKVDPDGHWGMRASFIIATVEVP